METESGGKSRKGLHSQEHAKQRAPTAFRFIKCGNLTNRTGWNENKPINREGKTVSFLSFNTLSVIVYLKSIVFAIVLCFIQNTLRLRIQSKLDLKLLIE